MAKKKSGGGSEAIVKTIEAIRAAREVIAMPVEDVNVKYRAGHGIRVRQAQDELPDLHTALSEVTIPSRLVGVFAEGDAAAIAMASTVVKDGGVVVDAAALWRAVAAPVEASMGPQRQWSPVQWRLMMQGVAEEARKQGFTDMAPLPLENEVATDSEADIAAYVAGLVAASPDIADLQLRTVRSAILEAVIDGDLTAPAVPVLVVGATPSETASLRRLFARATIHSFPPGADVFRAALVEILKAASPN